MPDGFHLHGEGPRHHRPERVADRLVVALDVPSITKARELVDRLDGVASVFKIGFLLWPADGADALISKIIRENKKVFLDAKMYDIPNTVERAVRTAAERGISFVTVHYNETVVRAAVAGRQDSNLKIFSVTLLTWLDSENLIDMGINRTTNEVVEWRTKRALDLGCDGVIASGDDDLARIKSLASERGKDLIIATPGIRPERASPDDHRRFATPARAIEAGADYLIVGRPIYGAPDPGYAAHQIIREMETAASKRLRT